jgi:hypothetical protein
MARGHGSREMIHMDGCRVPASLIDFPRHDISEDLKQSNSLLRAQPAALVQWVFVG